MNTHTYYHYSLSQLPTRVKITDWFISKIQQIEKIENRKVILFGSGVSGNTLITTIEMRMFELHQREVDTIIVQKPYSRCVSGDRNRKLVFNLHEAEGDPSYLFNKLFVFVDDILSEGTTHQHCVKHINKYFREYSAFQPSLWVDKNGYMPILLSKGTEYGPPPHTAVYQYQVEYVELGDLPKEIAIATSLV